MKLLKQIHSLFVPAQSVDAILRTFNKVIEELKYTEEHHNISREQKTSRIRTLEAENIGHGLHAERAANVRAKIEQLVN